MQVYRVVLEVHNLSLTFHQIPGLPVQWLELLIVSWLVIVNIVSLNPQQHL